MKRAFILILSLALLISSLTALASENVTVMLDGSIIDCKDINGNSVPPLLIDGTTYLPVRAVSNALHVPVEWDGETQSVLLGGTPDKLVPGEGVTIYINKEKFIAKDVNGTVVEPILKDGTTYLPIRAIGEAFDKRVSLDDASKTAILTTPDFASFDENKTYAILNKASGKAITSEGSNLSADLYTSADVQAFKMVKSDTDGYYFIQSVSNGKNFDVNGNSKNPGASVITYNAGTADNQKFAVEITDEGYVIYAKSSRLPIEDSAGKIKQNTRRDSAVQRWEIKECSPIPSSSDKIYRTLSSGSFTLSDENSTEWLLDANKDGEYTITNKATNKSLDVANNSKTSGDPVITYQTSSDANQRWLIFRQEDGTYLIKSVHSGLYLSVIDNNIVQSASTQGWTIEIIK